MPIKITKKQRKNHYYESKLSILSTIENIYNEYSGRPGYRMMKIFLSRKNVNISNQTVPMYMKELGLCSIVVRKKLRYKKGDCYKKFDNHVNQNFTVDAPNKVWCTDFTYMYLEDGAKRYNCTILDLYDRSPVASLNGNRMNAELAIETLKAALSYNYGFPIRKIVGVLCIHILLAFQPTSVFNNPSPLLREVFPPILGVSFFARFLTRRSWHKSVDLWYRSFSFISIRNYANILL